MRWVKKVTTESTFPPAETFNQSAGKIAKTMADPKVSPKGLGSAIRMVQYFINRGGKNLSATRKRELEKAKHLLQQMRDEEQEKDKEKEKKQQTGSAVKKKSAQRSRGKHASKSRPKKKQKKKTPAKRSKGH